MSDRRDLVWLLVGAALFFSVSLGARDLWNPNEPLYGRAVVEMAERGEWLVPTVNDEVFGEKPILYFWLARVAALLLGGVNELTLRLPSAGCGVLGVLLLYLLVRPYTDRFRARLASILFGTIYVVFWSARQVQMDLLTTVLALGVVLAATRVLDFGLNPSFGWGLAGLFAAAGFLAKGPVACIAPGLVLFAYAVATGRARALLRQPSLLLGAAVFAVVAVPWFAALWAQGETGFLHEVLYRQNVTRFLDPWDHQSPWWYFLQYFWIDMAPWSLLVPLAWGLAGPDASARRLDRLAWVWIAVLIVFFSLSSSKRSTYIMPLAPAVAILASAVVVRFRQGSLDRLRTRVVLLLSAAAGVLLVAAGVAVHRLAGERYPLLGGTIPAVALTLGIGGAAILVASLSRRHARHWLPAAWISFVGALYGLTAIHVLPAVDTYKSARPFSERVTAIVDVDQPLRSYWAWKWRASYSYYCDRSIPWIETPDDLRSYWTTDEPVFLLTDRGALPEVRAIIGNIEPEEQARIGGNQVYLFSNR